VHGAANYRWWSTYDWTKWIDFLWKFKFHLNENIERHCTQLELNWIQIPYSRPQDMGEDWIAPILLANHGVLLRPIMYLCRREVLRLGNMRVNEDAKSLEFSLPIQFMLEHCTRFGNGGRKSRHGVFQKTDSMAQVRRRSLTSRFPSFSWLKHHMRHGKRTTCIQIPFWSKKPRNSWWSFKSRALACMTLYEIGTLKKPLRAGNDARKCEQT
jgi:hypothetical protein